MEQKKKIEAPQGVPVPDFPNYLVLPNGRIWNKKKGKYQSERTINGYIAVVLSEEGKAAQFYVGRLVAAAYVRNPNPEEFNKVRWKDGDRTNNHKDNLEWTNQQIATKLGNTGFKERPKRMVKEKIRA